MTSGGCFETYRIVIEPQGHLEAQPHMRGTEEYVTVFQGTAEIGAGEEVHRLNAGDSIRFPAGPAPPLRQRRGGAGPAEHAHLLRSRVTKRGQVQDLSPSACRKNLCSDESARVLAGEPEGAAARPRVGSNALNALHGKAFSERSEDFCAEHRRKSNGIFCRLSEKSLAFSDSLRGQVP